MRKFLGALALVACVAGAAAQDQAQAQGQALRTPIPIPALVSDPIFYSARLSPDGRYVVGVRRAPESQSLLRLDWRTEQVTVLQQVQRTGELENSIDWVTWKSNERLVASVSTTRPLTINNDRSAHIRERETVRVAVTRVVSMNADGSNMRPMFEGETRNLAYGAASTVLADIMPHDPNHVLVAAYGNAGLGLFRANVMTGETERVENGGWDGLDWGIDGASNVVLRREILPGGQGYRIFRRAPGQRDWIRFADVRGGENANSPDFDYVGPGPGPGLIWIAARPEGSNVAGLYQFNTATGEYGPVQYENANADFEGDIWISRSRDRLLAACVRYQRRECRYFDEDIGRHIRAVDAFFDRTADVTLIDMSDDGNVWLVYVQGPTIAPSYYIYDRAGRAVVPVAPITQVSEEHLSPTQVVSYQGRDGTALWGYLTVPASAPATGAPMVVLPHGGPEARDYYGYDPDVQFLASRGYLVFQPQFRGSGGFGNRFAHAGRRQWGQAMQHDVTDGVQSLIQSGRVDARRICIVGTSYGGYAALAGATLTPELYRCAVSINGVGDLREMLRTEAIEGGRRSRSLDYWRLHIGDRNNDRAAIEAVSPRLQAAAARAPILLIAGEFDGVVPVEQSRDMFAALRSAGRDARYVEISREGHSWPTWMPERRVQLFTEVETFLAAHLN